MKRSGKQMLPRNGGQQSENWQFPHGRLAASVVSRARTGSFPLACWRPRWSAERELAVSPWPVGALMQQICGPINTTYYNSPVFHRRSFGQNKRCFALRKKKALPSVWLLEIRNSCTSVRSNTCALEQQERNETKTHMKKVRRKERIWT